MSSQSRFPSERLDKFILRMPDGLRGRLKRSADCNRRSMNAEAIYLLERAIPEDLETQKADATA